MPAERFRVRDAGLTPGRLRSGHSLVAFSKPSPEDLERFRADMRDRLRPAEDRVARPDLTLHLDAQLVMQEAIAVATKRRSDVVHGFHLLHALTCASEGAVADLLARYGSSAATVNVAVERAL